MSSPSRDRTCLSGDSGGGLRGVGLLSLRSLLLLGATAGGGACSNGLLPLLSSSVTQGLAQHTLWWWPLLCWLLLLPVWCAPPQHGCWAANPVAAEL